MNTEMNIPYELTLFYVDKGSAQVRFFPEIVSKKLVTKQKRKKIYKTIKSRESLYLRNTVEDKDITEVTILNSNFEIFLDDAFTDEYFYYDRSRIRNTREYSSTVIRIWNKELDVKFSGKPVYIYVELNNFLDVIGKSRYITNGKIHGNYCIRLSSSDSDCIFLEKDDPTNDVLEKSKKIGKLLGTKQKTTKWKPGYKYALSSTEYVIYLGNVRFKQYNNLYYKYSKQKNVFNSLFNHYSIGEIVDDNLELCISSDYLNENIDEKEFLENNSNLEIDDVLEKFLSFNNIINSGKKSFPLTAISKSGKKGVEVEKCFDVPNNFDLENTIINIIESNYINKIDLNEIINCSSEQKLYRYDELNMIGINLDYFLSNNPELRQVLLNKLLELFCLEYKHRLSSYYYSNSLEKTSNDVLTNCGYYKYQTIFTIKILMDLFCLTEDKLKELIDSKLKSTTNGNN